MKYKMTQIKIKVRQSKILINHSSKRLIQRPRIDIMQSQDIKAAKRVEVKINQKILGTI